jgi:hypothetical protein
VTTEKPTKARAATAAPATENLPIIIDPEAYARAVASQRGMARKAADELEAGNLPASPIVRHLAAALLRAWADNLTTAKKRSRGEKLVTKLPSGEAALLRIAGYTQAQIAEHFDCSERAVAAALKKHKAAIERAMKLIG